MTIEKDHLDLVTRLSKDPVEILKQLDWERVQCWHMVTGMTTEAIEMLRDVHQYIKGNAFDASNETNFIKELGDYEFYLAGLLNWMGLENVPCPTVFQSPYISAIDGIMRLLLGTGAVIDEAKAFIVYNKEMDWTKLQEAVKEVHAALAILRAWIGVDREEVLRVNMEKLSKRQPTGTYVDEHAIARKDET